MYISKQRNLLWFGLFTLAGACDDSVATTITGGKAPHTVFFPTDAAAADQPSNCSPGALEFRALLIVKTKAQVSGEDYAISQTEVNQVSVAFLTTVPDWASKISNGRLCFTPEVFVSPTPLQSFTNVCGGQTPWTGDIEAEIEEQAPRGKYDNIYLYAPNGGSFGSCASWPAAASNYAGFTYLNPPGEGAWTDPDNYIFDHAIWGWVVGMWGFYRGLSGVEPPRSPDPSDGADYGYSLDQPPFAGWMTWYGDILKRAVMQDGTPSGLGEPAWAHGTIRAAARP